MNTQTFVDKIKDVISHYAWIVFLWAGGWTDDSFSDAKYLDEKRHREMNHLPL